MVRFATLVFAATSAAAMAYSPRNAGAGDLLSSVGGKPKPSQSELNSMTVEQVTDVCGENLEVNCCNEETTSIDAAGESTGVLSNLFASCQLVLLHKAKASDIERFISKTSAAQVPFTLTNSYYFTLFRAMPCSKAGNSPKWRKIVRFSRQKWYL